MDIFGQDVLHFRLLRTEPIVYLLSQMKESHGVDWTLPLDWPVSEVGRVGLLSPVPSQWAWLEGIGQPSTEGQTNWTHLREDSESSSGNITWRQSLSMN